MKWTVSVTTTSRINGGYLQETISAMKAAGWWKEVAIHDDVDQSLGPWGNLIVAIRAAASADPDVALFVQDDTLISANAREYIETTLPMLDSIGIASLYLNEATEKKVGRGWSIAPMEKMGQWGG